jgi:hypothetical protein
MTRNRLNLRTRPVDRPALRPGARRPSGLDGLHGRAFTAATEHPWVTGAELPLCAEEDPELFWPATVVDAERAKAVCQACPLAASCLAVARRRGEWGVWGGQLLAKGHPTEALPGNVRETRPDDHARSA